ncbi:MAG: UDP-N-acetylmuramoyl-L-alanine--D-glutamate ligase [Methylohalobius sp.]|nr:UDP-N-acetylmuramoyl-L-alanine--D-glutamate ligase [Methylohalobius sp.]
MGRQAHASSALGLDHDARVVVVGLGKTGVSALRFLCRQGIACLAIDSREQPPGLSVAQELSVPVFTGSLRSDWLCGATHLLVSPGVELDRPEIRTALERGVALISDIDLFADQVQGPVVGVTGSNGKSTVTTLVAEMAKASGIRAVAGGNLGTPALDLLTEECELYVLELSSFQLERTRRLKLTAGAILNISPDHLDRHRDLASYAAIKGKLLQFSQVKVINGDDPLVGEMARQKGWDARSDARRSEATSENRDWIRFSLTDPEADYGLVRYQGQECLACRGEPLFAASAVRLVGRHNLANALAALALAEAVGVPREGALSTLPHFAGLPHRMQRVAQIDGVDWINDSKGTNIGATEAAIAGLAGPVILLAGGDGKGADFSQLKLAVAGKVRAAVLYGRDRHLIARALAEVTAIYVVEDLPQAVATARKIARAGDTVLLSPACASFDQFENYQARGECFTREVLRWQQ